MCPFYFKERCIAINNNNFNPYNKLPNKNGDYIVNESIRFPQVLVIGSNGNPLGVKTRNEALSLAREENLDLLCVAPNATPPVCKILNFGKYRYEQEKKAKEIKKKQVIIETKEIRLSPVIDKHDIETKAKQALKFFASGNKVKVSLRFRGRQLAHPEVGEEVLNRFIDMCSEKCVVERAAVLDGKILTATLAPKK